MGRKSKKRVMVDMSATLIHQGHTNLLERASQFGSVVVGLTTDDEVLRRKGYEPELPFECRKEIIHAINGVDEVVPTPWLITEKVLNDYQIDLLIHGDDNANQIPKERLLLLPRTEGISSTEIRLNTLRSITQINNHKLMLTPGPAALLYESLQYLKPVFGRGDKEYIDMEEKVLEWLKKLSGQDEIVVAQGSASFAIELAVCNFVSGNVLLLSTGYYSDRIESLLPDGSRVTVCKIDDINKIEGSYDWVVCTYTETGLATIIDLAMVRKSADKFGALLMVDATGSIGLEDNHDLADVLAFSSCIGLFGLSGAAFVAHKSGLATSGTDRFYMNINTHKNRMVTGPNHAIASLFGVIDIHETIKERVRQSKSYVMSRWSEFVRSTDNQPLLCTYLEGKIYANDESIVLYSPRSDLRGSVICHLGEIHHDYIEIGKRISIV
jgi:2-aminoethylphosphonate-pyruvate transaminase